MMCGLHPLSAPFSFAVVDVMIFPLVCLLIKSSTWYVDWIAEDEGGMYSLACVVATFLS